MFLPRVQQFLVGLVILVIFSGCGSGGAGVSSGTSSTGGNTSSGNVVGGNVSELTVADGSASVTFTDLTEDETVVVAVYSYNSGGETTEAFQLGSLNSPPLLTSDTEEVSSSENVEENSFSPTIGGELDITSEFHAILRDMESDLDEEAVLDESTSPTRSLVRTLTTGATDTFRVLSSFSNTSSYTTVTATLRYQTDDVEFWVDDRNAASITDAEIESLAEDFAEHIPVEREIYGEESDVNGDGKFAVLMTQVVNALGNGSGIVTGFFYAQDLFDTSAYPNSNEREMVYMLVPDPSGSYGATISKSFFMSNLAAGVLVHEYQHMINFNQHYFINSSSTESSWLNEGLSHLAEDIYSKDSSNYFTGAGIENPARVEGYLENISTVCFSCGTSLDERGGSYLFLRYLYEQAQKGNLSGATSGIDLIGNLLDTTNRGVTNVVRAALGSSATDSDFKTLLGNFSVALYISNTETNSADTLNFEGIDLRATQDDNRGTVLDGPAVQDVTALPFTDTVLGSGMNYISIPASLIQENGNTLEFTFSTDADFGAYLIRQ